MDWIEISIQTSHEATEAVANIFHDLGAGGVVIEDPELINSYRRSGEWDYCAIAEAADTEVVVVKAYLPADGLIYDKLQELENYVEELSEINIDKGRGVIDCRTVRDEDWSLAWKQYFHTFKLGSRLVINPAWEEYEQKENDIVIKLDPGLAFGTGMHPSTAMCAVFLESVVKEGQVVFDIGTGSGILSIAAAKLGAFRVEAVDNDLTAVNNASENISVNHLKDKIRVSQGDLLTGLSGQADVIVANIVAAVIIKMLPAVKGSLKKGGWFIAGGIIAEKLGEVAEAIKEAGLVLDKVSEDGAWAAILARRV